MNDGHQRRAWLVALASLAALTVATGAQYVAVVGMKPIALEMGWPRAVPSAAYAFSLLGMGVGGILMGRWSDRVGVARPAVAGALMLALGAGVASWAESAWTLVAANGLLMGLLGNAAFFTPLLANTTRWFTRNRGVAVAVVSAGQSLGGAVWPPVHRYVIEAAGWRAAYVVYAAVTLAVCLPLAAVLRLRPPVIPSAPAPGPARPAEARAARIDAGDPRALGLSPRALHAMLCLAIVGCCVAMSMPMVHIVAHGTDLGHPPARTAEVLSVLLFSAFLSRLLWGALSDRIGGLATLLLGAACQAVMLSTFLVVSSLPGLYVTAALYGLAYGGIVPMYAVIVREHFPLGELGGRIGVVYLFGTIGMAAGGVLGGLVFDLAGSYRGAFALGVAFNGANLALIGPLAWRERRGSRAAAAATPRTESVLPVVTTKE